MIYLPIGIEVDDARVAAVLMSIDGDERRIENVVVEKHDGTEAGIASAFAGVRAHLRSEQRSCVLVLGEKAALLDRYVDTTGQATQENKLQQSAYYHARRVFRAHLGAESAILVDEDASQTGAMWLSLVQSPDLAQLVRAARATGLRPIAATHESLTLKRALPGVDVAVVYMLNRATIIVLSEKTPIYEHVSVEALVEGADNFDSVRRLAAAAGARIEELRSGNFHKINRLAIVGRRERLDSFQSALAAQLIDNVSVEIADVSATKAALPPDVIARYSPEVAEAYGAALYGTVAIVPDLDLLRADYSQTVAVIRETPHLRNGVLAVAAALIVALLTHNIAHSRLADVQRRLPDLRAKIATGADTAMYVDSVEQRERTLSQIAQQIVSMRESANERVFVATSVLNALPSWAAVSEIKRDGDGWTVKGFAPDEGHVGEIMAQLRRSKNIQDVSQKGIDNRGKRMEFTLHLQVAEAQ